MTVATTRASSKLLAIAVSTAAALVAVPAATPGPLPRAATDGVLRVPLMRGWTGAIDSGFQGSHPVAWIDAGNFRFPLSAARHEGGPTVPPGKLLIAIGDFVVSPSSRTWPSVEHLHLPARVHAQRVFARFRFKGRAVVVEAEFGSRPDAPTVRLANRVLHAVSRR
jgi:hypothetical protein